MVQKRNLWRVLTRRKILNADGVESESKLNRALGLYDLTALGVGSTLGAGVYVLAGQIAKEQAGPSVMISFAIAAIASLLAGICYAEFGARVPKAGSAYVYSYVCIGEFVAFVIGWNLALEYMVGTASVCRGISLYLDTMLNDTLKTVFADIAPMNITFLASYFDFLAFGLVIVFGVALAFGVETSTFLNNFCTSVNIFILLFVIIAGAIKADISNWNINPANVNVTNTDIGYGGYFPFGFQGTMKGAATCFFGFVGFDCIATTGEEVRDPRRNIPRSILLSLFLIFIFYFGVSTVLTLMLPYYLQDSNAPLPHAFKAVGWDFAMWIVSVGGLVGLLASLFGALFPLPRVLYSMAQDGLLFRFLGKINARYRAPVSGSIFAAIITALMAGIFDLQQLVHLLSIGTLLAYSCVAISVTILRYMQNNENYEQVKTAVVNEHSSLTSNNTRFTWSAVTLQIFKPKRIAHPNTISTRIVGVLITFFCLLSFGVGLLIMRAYTQLVQHQVWAWTLMAGLLFLMLLVIIIISGQPRETAISIFRVPFVPILPAISIFINVYLMLQLDIMTWIRFGVWMAIGVPMFLINWCKYDIKNPAKRNPQRLEFLRLLQPPMENNLKAAEDRKLQYTADEIKYDEKISETALQNEHSVKSVDEIVKLSEVSKDLIEMKLPNGKVFYIEDSRNNSPKTSVNNSSASSEAGSDIAEEEKSVIAYLDDVLSAEDEQPKTASSKNTASPTFRRKTSQDSELIPSVIETTTVAMIHSSSGSSDQDLEKLADLDEELNINAHIETKRIAKQLVDSIFQDERLLQLLAQPKTNEFTNFYVETAESASNASLTSQDNIEDALHSVAFKNRLSQFLLQAQLKPQLKSPKDISPEPEAAKLRHSKSEEHMRQSILKSIENSNLKKTYTLKETNGIPKAPKFDPVLYQTINTSKLNGKTRANIPEYLDNNQNELLNKTIAIVAKTDSEETVARDPPLPFRKRLEAVLQRGPPLNTQRPFSARVSTDLQKSATDENLNNIMDIKSANTSNA